MSMNLLCCRDIYSFKREIALKNTIPSPTTAMTTHQPPPLSPMPFLSDEIIFEILLKLPARSVLQCRCVCKSWKTLISHPQFVRDHLHTSISDSIITHQQLPSSVDDERSKIVTCFVNSLFGNVSTPAEIETLTFARERGYSIVGSCNGMVCFCGSDGCFRLWNPSTRFESERSPPQPYSLYTHVGFGYDQVNNKYKVLVAVWSVFNVTKVHTFGTDSWTAIRHSPSGLRSSDKVGKFVGGHLNWFALKEDRKMVIISFDLEKETCGEVPLPPHRDVYRLTNHVLDVLRNCLCVCFYLKNNWVVWFMKNYGVQKSWTKLMVIPHDKLLICRSIPGFQLLSEKGVQIVRLMENFRISNV